MVRPFFSVLQDRNTLLPVSRSYGRGAFGA